MNGNDFLVVLGQQLAQELTAHETIRNFVGRHPALIGSYAEASLRKFIADVVSPLNVSTGTIIYEGNIGKKPPQLDAIIWSPAPVPAVFEKGDFAIIPRGSAHGFIEIKSSSYTSAGDDIANKLAFDEELIQPRPEGYVGALGVVCVATKLDKRLRQLVHDNRAVVLLTMRGNKVEPNIDGIWALVNFLTKLRLRAIETEGRWFVNFPAIGKNADLQK